MNVRNGWRAASFVRSLGGRPVQQQTSVGQTPGTDGRPALAESARRDQPWAGPVGHASMLAGSGGRGGHGRSKTILEGMWQGIFSLKESAVTPSGRWVRPLGQGRWRGTAPCRECGCFSQYPSTVVQLPSAPGQALGGSGTTPPDASSSAIAPRPGKVPNPDWVFWRIPRRCRVARYRAGEPASTGFRRSRTGAASPVARSMPRPGSFVNGTARRRHEDRNPVQLLRGLSPGSSGLGEKAVEERFDRSQSGPHPDKPDGEYGRAFGRRRP